MNNNLELKLKAKKIKLVAFDVDGVMTDGSLTFDENGVEYKTFNAKDGQGIVMLNRHGFKTAIITARDNGTVECRAKMLGITKLFKRIKKLHLMIYATNLMYRLMKLHTWAMICLIYVF